MGNTVFDVPDLLDSQDLALLEAVATGSTPQEAAKKAGMSRSTAYRRLADPAFRARISRIQDEMLDAAGVKAAASCELAVTTLAAMLAGDDKTLALRAATVLLDQAVKLRDAGAQARKVIELEAMLERFLAGTTQGAAA